MASIINTGISALNAFKRQMETTGHNIANVNTEGYSRQVVHLGAREPEAAPQGYIGSGVDVTSVRRAYDNFLATRVRDYNASYQEFAVYEQRASQIDSVIADASSGLDSTLQQLFASINDVADDPTSIPARSVLLNRASQLVDRFNTLDGWLTDMRNGVNRDLQTEVEEINSIAQSLAQVNTRIGTLNGATGGIPNDILDQRDKLVDDLSRFSNVSTLVQSDGSMNVFIGTGQALVVGGTANRLAVIDNPAALDHKELVIQQTNGLPVIVTSQMSGGSLGGLLRFRDEVLDATQNALGRVAIGLGEFFNAEHRTGMDLDDDLGGDFFAVAAPDVQAAPGNSGSITAGFADVAALTGHEYQLDYDGAAWSVTDLDTGVTTALAGSGPFVIDGVGVTVNAVTPGISDSYRIRPTRLGASGIGLLVASERDIAAAEPVRASAGTNALSGLANGGSAAITPGALTARSGAGSWTAPVTLTYDSTLQQFNLSSGGSFAYNPASQSGATQTVGIAGLGDFAFAITGTPADGDRFVLHDNSGGVSDNRNARRLADLQTANLMIGGTATFANTYGALIADVGTKTHQAGSNATVQEHLLEQAEGAKSEVSGVNLDEEAANLVRFQQAYQAAAQVISVANTLFDSLLGAVRR